MHRLYVAHATKIVVATPRPERSSARFRTCLACMAADAVGDGFNLLNRVNYTSYVGTISSPVFGSRT